MGGIPPSGHGGKTAFQFRIACDPMLCQKVHGPGRLFQIVQLRPMREPSALLGFEIVLDINEQADPSVALFRPLGRSGAPGDPGGNGFLRVVHAQGFHPGKPFLAGSAAGNIFPPLDFITLPLQAEQ